MDHLVPKWLSFVIYLVLRIHPFQKYHLDWTRINIQTHMFLFKKTRRMSPLKSLHIFVPVNNWRIHFEISLNTRIFLQMWICQLLNLITIGFQSGANRKITNAKALWRQLKLSNNFGQMEFDCLILPTTLLHGYLQLTLKHISCYTQFMHQ